MSNTGSLDGFLKDFYSYTGNQKQQEIHTLYTFDDRKVMVFDLPGYKKENIEVLQVGQRVEIKAVRTNPDNTQTQFDYFFVGEPTTVELENGQLIITFVITPRKVTKLL